MAVITIVSLNLIKTETQGHSLYIQLFWYADFNWYIHICLW